MEDSGHSKTKYKMNKKKSRRMCRCCLCCCCKNIYGNQEEEEKKSEVELPRLPNDVYQPQSVTSEEEGSIYYGSTSSMYETPINVTSRVPGVTTLPPRPVSSQDSGIQSARDLAFSPIKSEDEFSERSVTESSPVLTISGVIDIGGQTKEVYGRLCLRQEEYKSATNTSVTKPNSEPTNEGYKSIKSYKIGTAPNSTVAQVHRSNSKDNSGGSSRNELPIRKPLEIPTTKIQTRSDLSSSDNIEESGVPELPPRPECMERDLPPIRKPIEVPSINIEQSRSGHDLSSLDNIDDSGLSISEAMERVPDLPPKNKFKQYITEAPSKNTNRYSYDFLKPTYNVAYDHRIKINSEPVYDNSGDSQSIKTRNPYYGPIDQRPPMPSPRLQDIHVYEEIN